MRLSLLCNLQVNLQRDIQLDIRQWDEQTDQQQDYPRERAVPVNRARRAAVVMLLLIPLFSVDAAAHLPEYFGRKYVLIDGQPEPQAPECGKERESLRDEASRLKEELAGAVLEAGAYSASLADPVGELGKLYLSLCNHPAALNAHRNALQIIRVNEGLLSPAQIPYLYALAESYEAIGDFRSAQQALRSVFRVHDMGQGLLNAAALRDSLAYFQRARSIFIDPRSRGEINLFFEAFNDTEHMLDTQLERDDLDYATREALSLSHLRNLYLLLGTDFVSMSGVSGDATSPAVGFMQRSQMLTYGKGRTLLEDLLPRAEGQSRATKAKLYFRLGNWQQWNAKWGQACDSYVQAWEFADGSDGAALRKKMARPAELPEDGELWRSLLDPAITVSATVRASYRVSPKGDVSRVDAITENEGSSGLAARVTRWLRDSHARPAVIDGSCVEGELVGRRYHLLD